MKKVEHRVFLISLLFSIMVGGWLWLSPAIQQKADIVSRSKQYMGLMEQAKAIQPIKLVYSPQYHWSAMLQQYSLAVVSMRPEGGGLSLICQGDYPSLLRFMDALMSLSVEVDAVALSSTAFHLHLLPSPLQTQANALSSLDVSTVMNPFEERKEVLPPLTLDRFLQAHWVVMGYVQDQDYLCLYLGAKGQRVFLYPGQRLFGDVWEVKVLTPQGVVMWNRNSGSTLKKQFDLPTAPKSG